ncbi:MAG: vanadium-dependent haloperoxidase [Phycisphaerales bacterium]|nr:vanadium-dependent haloperoxidase [Phycisphaerales bacterium]
MKARGIFVGSVLAWTTIGAHADVVTDWSEITLDAIRHARSAPPLAARNLAMVHVAMYDAVNAVTRTHESYLDITFHVPSKASVEAAAAAAAHEVLRSLYPAEIATLDAALEASLAALTDDADVVEQGVNLGTAVGDLMLETRASDGTSASVSYTITNNSGDWQPTPPAFAQSPALPQWPNVKAFCLEDVASLRRPGPPALDSAEYATAFNEVKSLGAADSTTRTADQSLIANFWVDGPGTSTPPGHWFQIARDVAAQQGNTLEENARLFALIGLAVCDAGICAWDNKYAYNHWRPVTGIRAADTDGNDATEADADWTPFIPTPAFPAYISGHSTFSGAASKILALFYDQDDIAFDTTSDDVPNVTRSFERFSAAANEAGRSRIYGGIHWEYDNQDGLASGRELALEVFSNFLRPVESLDNDASDDADTDGGSTVQCAPLSGLTFGLMTLSMMGLRRARPHKRF